MHWALKDVQGGGCHAMVQHTGKEGRWEGRHPFTETAHPQLEVLDK
jgi:hypothetical protein